MRRSSSSLREGRGLVRSFESHYSKTKTSKTKQKPNVQVKSKPKQVKPKQAGTCGRSIRNEHTSKSLICTNIKYYRTYSIYLLSRLYAILLPSQRKLHVNVNLASWMMLRAPLTSASLFCFYYNSFHINFIIMNEKCMLKYCTIASKINVTPKGVRLSENLQHSNKIWPQ